MFESFEIVLTVLVLAAALVLIFSDKVPAGTRALAVLNIILATLWLLLGAWAAAVTLLVLGGLVIPLLFKLADAAAGDEVRR
ncbi:MAG: hypothetical protein ACYC55_07095 [Candidatus Geothermincolia bacterium]